MGEITYNVMCTGDLPEPLDTADWKEREEVEDDDNGDALGGYGGGAAPVSRRKEVNYHCEKIATGLRR